MKQNNLLKWCLVVLAALAVLGSVTLIGFAQESTEQNAPSPTLTIKTFNLSLENAVFMNFKVANENVSDPASIQLLAWDEAPAEYKKGTEDLTLSSVGTESGTGYEVFKYTDLAAKDMTKMVYVCAYINENGVEAYSAPAKFSIAMYAYLKKNATNPDTELCTLLDSMLAYGAAAQTYFDYNTDLLATDTIHQIKVTGGTLPDGFALGWYKENTTVTLTANAPEEGYVFSHWTNSAGEGVSTEATITVDVTKAETYTANYKDKDYQEPIVYSTGLEFTSNGDETCYVSGIGTCTDSVINIPPVSPEGWTVTGIGYQAFRARSNLTSITIPDSVTSIGNFAFDGCYKLVELINHSDLSITVGSLDNGYVAHNAKEVHTGTTKIVNQNDYLFYTYNGVNYLLGYVGTDTELTLPSTYYGRYEIYRYAFNGCDNLTSTTIPSSVTGIGSYAFNSCDNLTSITIPDSVTSIGSHAFDSCSNLKSISFGENSQLTSIGDYAFQRCGFKQITIPASVTRIGCMVFYESGLSSISIGGSWYSTSRSSYTGGTLTTPTVANFKYNKYNLYWYKA